LKTTEQIDLEEANPEKPTGIGLVFGYSEF
jgi:hypothetical protein